MKDIAGYEGQYAVTEDGKVWSYKRNSFLSPNRIYSGYLRVGLRDSKNGQKRKAHSIHRLVAIAYIENPEGKEEVNHKNGVRYDNRVENLEWATRSENNQHAWTHGNKKFVLTEKFRKSVSQNARVATAARMAKRTHKGAICNTIM